MSLVFPRTGDGGFLKIFTDNLVWPTCPTTQVSFQTLFNHRGQDPCTIALNLLEPCDPHLEEATTAFDVVAFQNSPCACNTVLYSLFNVCGRCAGNDDFGATTWNTFRHTLSCAEPVNQAYIQPVPSNAAIPEWAYLPLGADGEVDLTQAREVATHNDPDMTSPGSYILQPQSAGGASQMLTLAPTSDSTAPRSVSFTTANPIATPTASSDLSITAVPVLSSPSTDNLAISTTITAMTPPPGHYENVTQASASSPTQETASHSPTLSSVIQGPASIAPSSTVVIITLHSISPQSTPQNQIAKSRNLAPIFGGVLGGIAVAVLAAYLATRLVRRRRRRRREKEAVFASGSLDWWRRPNADLHDAGREFTEGSTVKAETDLDDLETLHCATSVDKKSVTYGEYPDP